MGFDPVSLTTLAITTAAKTAAGAVGTAAGAVGNVASGAGSLLFGETAAAAGLAPEIVGGATAPEMTSTLAMAANAAKTAATAETAAAKGLLGTLATHPLVPVATGAGQGMLAYEEADRQKKAAKLAKEGLREELDRRLKQEKLAAEAMMKENEIRRRELAGHNLALLAEGVGSLNIPGAVKGGFAGNQESLHGNLARRLEGARAATRYQIRSLPQPKSPLLSAAGGSIGGFGTGLKLQTGLKKLTKRSPFSRRANV